MNVDALLPSQSVGVLYSAALVTTTLTVGYALGYRQRLIERGIRTLFRRAKR